MKLTMDIECPGCKRNVKVRVEEMRPGGRKRCACGSVLKFEGDDGRKAQRALDDFEKSLKKLSF